MTVNAKTVQTILFNDPIGILVLILTAIIFFITRKIQHSLQQGFLTITLDHTNKTHDIKENDFAQQAIRLAFSYLSLEPHTANNLVWKPVLIDSGHQSRTYLVPFQSHR